MGEICLDVGRTMNNKISEFTYKFYDNYVRAISILLGLHNIPIIYDRDYDGEEYIADYNYEYLYYFIGMMDEAFVSAINRTKISSIKELIEVSDVSLFISEVFKLEEINVKDDEMLVGMICYDKQYDEFEKNRLRVKKVRRDECGKDALKYAKYGMQKWFDECYSRCEENGFVNWIV